MTKKGAGMYYVFSPTAMKQALSSARMSRKELAEKSGVSRSTIDMLMTKKVVNPGMSAMLQLADALGLEDPRDLAEEFNFDVSRGTSGKGAR